MDWLHTDNEHGPEALLYRRTGGRPPFCPKIAAALDEAVLCSSRHQYILVGYRTIKDHGSVIARE
jgi:hypothetical protein